MSNRLVQSAIDIKLKYVVTLLANL